VGSGGRLRPTGIREAGSAAQVNKGIRIWTRWGAAQQAKQDVDVLRYYAGLIENRILAMQPQ
jgi:hypothetical protein